MQLSSHYWFKHNSLASFLTAAVLVTTPYSSIHAGWFSPSTSNQTAADQLSTETVKKALMEDPSMVYDALVLYQKEKAEAKKQAVQDYLKTNARKLFYSKADGVLGNPTGKVSILFLNDYRCGFCSKARAVVKSVMEENDDVRVVIKQLPILGPESKYAAQAATYAQQKNKFESFDTKLIAQEKPLTTEKINTALEQSGLKPVDVTSQSDSLDTVIRENYMYAQNLAVQGTPVIIIANSNLTKVEFIDNVLDMKAISEKISEYQT